MAESVCGPMLEMLTEAIDHPDKDCVDFFRYGADLYGELQECGLAEAMVWLCSAYLCITHVHLLQDDKPSADETASRIEKLIQERAASNSELLNYLSEVLLLHVHASSMMCFVFVPG